MAFCKIGKGSFDNFECYHVIGHRLGPGFSSILKAIEIFSKQNGLGNLLQSDPVAPSQGLD